MERSTPVDAAGPPAATRREHVGTVLFGLWMTAGLFLDGYFHQSLETTGESFFTPWHGAFYSGFVAAALWLTAMARRRAVGPSRWPVRSLPPGYRGAGWGLALFAAGGVGDVVWHTSLGVERGIDALLSPTHLLLFAGLLLILTAPARAFAAVAEDRPGRWVIVGSIVSATALVGFFANFAWGLGISALTRVPYDAMTDAGETSVIAGVASTLVTTAILFGAARLLLATEPPPGAVFVLFATVAFLVSAAFDEDIEGVIAALVGGAVLEAIWRFRPRLGAGLAAPVSFAGAAAVMWFAYFTILAGLDGIAWPAELWAGSAVLSGLVGAWIGSTGARIPPPSYGAGGG